MAGFLVKTPYVLLAQRDRHQRRLGGPPGRGSRTDRALRLGPGDQRPRRSVPLALPKRRSRSCRRLARSAVQPQAARSGHARGRELDQVPSVLSRLVGAVEAARRSIRATAVAGSPTARCGWFINSSAVGNCGAAKASTANTCWPSCRSSIACTRRRSSRRFATCTRRLPGCRNRLTPRRPSRWRNWPASSRRGPQRLGDLLIPLLDSTWKSANPRRSRIEHVRSSEFWLTCRAARHTDNIVLTPRASRRPGRIEQARR